MKINLDKQFNNKKINKKYYIKNNNNKSFQSCYKIKKKKSKNK